MLGNCVTIGWSLCAPFLQHKLLPVNFCLFSTEVELQYFSFAIFIVALFQQQALETFV